MEILIGLIEALNQQGFPKFSIEYEPLEELPYEIYYDQTFLTRFSHYLQAADYIQSLRVLFAALSYE